MLKNGRHLQYLLGHSKRVALPLCKLHLAVVERLEDSSDPESCTGGDIN